MGKQTNVILESYYYSPQDKDLYMIIQSKQEPDGSKTAVLKDINGSCKLVYDYNIVGSSMSWLHGVTYSDQNEALRDLLAEKEKAGYISPNINSVFKKQTPKY